MGLSVWDNSRGYLVLLVGASHLPPLRRDMLFLMVFPYHVFMVCCVDICNYPSLSLSVPPYAEV